ncbi:hypothetical protein [Kangiella sediminilitoris]|uniref:Glycine zipper-like domain-containing protein n=1 Tax=Kangiella sediminilitoris TaxID=1144748 RepID=A0A1B3BC49_9GAMM|nr:hypothetical protein [Kangiella sediminilitoris]AOE50381.1 hypothetical protein KS2013_1671 [Kangiella sediminilitoris]
MSNKQPQGNNGKTYVGAMLGIGVGVGAAFGITFENLPLGVGLGAVFGIIIGIVLEVKNKNTT